MPIAKHRKTNHQATPMNKIQAGANPAVGTSLSVEGTHNS
jgi:hypothetical protein